MSTGKGKDPVPGVATRIQQNRNCDDGLARKGRSVKEMMAAVKDLMKGADNLNNDVCKLQGKYADILAKATCLFDPSVVRMIQDDPVKAAGGNSSSPEPVDDMATKESVNDAYINLSSQCSQRPGPSTDLDY